MKIRLTLAVARFPVIAAIALAIAGCSPAQTQKPASADVRRKAVSPTPASAGELDRDVDGVFDSADQCPDDPEDYDGFQDADGCPDPDNDPQLILDVDDLCSSEPEDLDGSDGCTEPDNSNRGYAPPN